jgi:hypothetical protein
LCLPYDLNNYSWWIISLALMTHVAWLNSHELHHMDEKKSLKSFSNLKVKVNWGWDINLGDVGFQVQKFETIKMCMLENIGTNERIEHLHRLPRWGRNAKGYTCVCM